MENEFVDEFQPLVQRWLAANPMHCTIYGQWLNIVNNDRGIEAYSQWFAEQVASCVAWNDANPEQTVS